MTSSLTDDLRARLLPHADPARAAQMAAYLKTDMPMFGVSRPQQKVVFRAFLKDHPPADQRAWLEGMRALWTQPEREFKYAALAWAQAWKRKRYLDLAAVPALEQMVREGAWWDLVDELAANCVGAVVSAHREAMRPVLRAWITDDDLWIRRTALLCQLRHRTETDVPLLFEFVRLQAEDRSFWIRKAIGWALRHHAHTDPDVVRRFLAEHGAELSGLSRREAAKHLGPSTGPAT